MTPKRIAYVLNIFPKISETFIAGELAELRKRGVELRILSLLPPRDEPESFLVTTAVGLDGIVSYRGGAFDGNGGALLLTVKNVYSEVLQGEERIRGDGLGDLHNDYLAWFSRCF